MASDLFALLAEYGQRFVAERDPVAVLDVACRTIHEQTGAEFAIAAAFDAPGGPANVILTSGCDAATTDHLRRAHEVPTLFQDVARSGRIHHAGHADAGQLGLPDGHAPITSLIIAPLTASARAHGVLVVASTAAGAAFGDRDDEVAMVLATQAGVTYENAVLINGLKAQAAALQDHQAISEFVLDATQVGLYQRDLKTEQSTASQSLLKLLDLQGAPTLDELRTHLHDDDRNALQAATMKAMADRADYGLDVRVVRPSGAVRDLYARGRVTVDAHGEPDRLLGAFIDVTDRRSLEAQFRQAQKMEAVGRLAGGVAHDFNNLLTVIGGYGRFLDDAVTTDEARGDLNEILKAVERATALTRQLLAFSRKRTRELTVFDVNTLVKDLAGMLRRLMGEHIAVTTALAEHLPAIHADRGQIEQVVMNLAVNARDAMPRGGEFRITTESRLIDGAEWTCLVAADNGAGMPADVKAQIFEPFFTTKPVGKGTGLGLSTVQAIVEECAGRISVDSTPGQGTTFTIALPISTAPVTPAGVEDTSVSGGRERVLLVEDDEAVRALSQSILARAGYTVVTASGVDDGLEVGGRQPVDVLVTDVLISGGTGPDVFHRLQQHWPALRVLYVSGYALENILDTRTLDTHAAFLPKPFTSALLLRRLRALLDRP